MNNVVVPIKRSPETHFDGIVSNEQLACELALTNIGDFEPLSIKIDCQQFMEEISMFDEQWVDYLPRTDRPNNRKGLVLTNLPGKTHRDNPSLAQASIEAGRVLSEIEFNQPTAVYKACDSLRPILDMFDPVGRTFLVKCNTGGYFVPHRDHPNLPRDVFRVAVFLNNCAPMDYDWLMGADTKLQIETGRAYYVNTRKTHRTMSWVNDSIHLIMNIPLTVKNVNSIINNLRHRH